MWLSFMLLCVLLSFTTRNVWLLCRSTHVESDVYTCVFICFIRLNKQHTIRQPTPICLIWFWKLICLNSRLITHMDRDRAAERSEDFCVLFFSIDWCIQRWKKLPIFLCSRRAKKKKRKRNVIFLLKCDLSQPRCCDDTPNCVTMYDRRRRRHRATVPRRNNWHNLNWFGGGGGVYTIFFFFGALNICFSFGLNAFSLWFIWFIICFCCHAVCVCVLVCLFFIYLFRNSSKLKH